MNTERKNPAIITILWFTAIWFALCIGYTSLENGTPPFFWTLIRMGIYALVFFLLYRYSKTSNYGWFFSDEVIKGKIFKSMCVALLVGFIILPLFLSDMNPLSFSHGFWVAAIMNYLFYGFWLFVTINYLADPPEEEKNEKKE